MHMLACDPGIIAIMKKVMAFKSNPMLINIVPLFLFDFVVVVFSINGESES
jgi:hypothetical protein